ncbi:hypothetical protein J6590_045197 [Homalodisca vitripennis]|nr:hypothetical protein J6590_045197 [Homalodisca vitripennis]
MPGMSRQQPSFPSPPALNCVGVGGCGATSDPWGGGDAIADRLAPLGSWPGGMLRPPAPTPTAMLLLLALQVILHTAGNTSSHSQY